MFTSTSSKIESASDLIAMMGKTLFSSDPDYGEDDSFLKQAEEMTNNAKQIAFFVKKKDYDGASRAFSNVRKSCDSCHEGFR
jgi:cytochrome c556